jgi:hypothetical protein
MTAEQLAVYHDDIKRIELLAQTRTRAKADSPFIETPLPKRGRVATVAATETHVLNSTLGCAPKHSTKPFEQIEQI